MKRFNLEEYLANPNKKVVTRDGRNVRIICTDKRGTHFPIVALVECKDKEETCYYPPNGYWNLYEKESDIDLFFASEKHEGWLNIYRSDECGFYIRGASPYESKEKADKVAKANPKTFFTTIKVQWRNSYDKH